MNNKNRLGRVTSSNAHKLIKTGRGKPFSAPGLTYIEEKQIERRIGSCLDANGAYSQPIAWGNFMELVIYSLLGIEYTISSKQTFLHKKHGEIWSGSPDLIIPTELIAEIKCYQKKKFAQYTDALILEVTEDFTLSDKIQNLKTKFPQEYWQMVSNASIMEVDTVEAITYMPYYSEYEDIKEIAENMDSNEQWKYRFIVEKPIEELPFLRDGGYYKNINKFRFKVPVNDLKLLEDRIIEAGKLIKYEA